MMLNLRRLNLGSRRDGLFLIGLCALLTVPGVCLADESFVLSTEYNNLWFFDASTMDVSTPAGGVYSNYFGEYPDPALTNASTPMYHGTAGEYSSRTNVAPVIPANSLFQIEWSSFGQPVEGLQPDFALGTLVLPPAGANTNVPPAGFIAVGVGDNPAAYYESVDGGVFWSPSTLKIFAAQPNDIEIDWIMQNGTTNQMVYFVGAVPTSRPARIFWTESPYDAPTINLQDLFPVVHYNSEVPPPVYEVVTNGVGDNISILSNVVAGVWIDDQKQLRAVGVNGIFLLEYYTTGTYEDQVEPYAIEVVEVLPPALHIRHVDISDRLLPRNSFWADTEGVEGLIANVTAGLNGPAYKYSNAGAKNGWVWAIEKTVDTPWNIEIYWEHKGLMDVNWPYELDWYSADWPETPQKVVYGATEEDTARVFIPPSLTARLLPYQEPPLHAILSASGKSFYTLTNGYSTLQYTTHDDIWFEVLQSVAYNDSVHFDPTSVDWPVGNELVPLGQHTHAMVFDPAESNYVQIEKSFLNGEPNWTFSAWINPATTNKGVIYSEGNPNVTFEITQQTNNSLHVAAWHYDYPDNWIRYSTPEEVLTVGEWQFVSVTLAGGILGQGDLTVCVGEHSYTGALQRVYHPQNNQAVIGASSEPVPVNHFAGQIEQLNLWNKAFDPDSLWKNRFVEPSGTEPYLLASFPFVEGTGSHVANRAGPFDGEALGDPQWCYGLRLPSSGDFPVFPGYIHQPEGIVYNVNRYSYPTENDRSTESYIFAVNKAPLEVWWAEPSIQVGLPDPVYYPYLVQRYHAVWPTNAAEIVIASGVGSGDWHGGAPSVYTQNDPFSPGYNPNEEHAVILGNVAYALRNDLNRPSTSNPFVLIDDLNKTTTRPEMTLFSVVATNSEYTFDYDVKAGVSILPPMPVGGMPLCSQNFTDDLDVAWKDRKENWWAKAAGKDGGSAEACMSFYYTMQPSFYFPGLPADKQPAIGTQLPWLPDPSSDQGLSGSPVGMTYQVTWPEEVAELKVTETLTQATRGLLDLWDQLSVDILYQQSVAKSDEESVVLFDPIESHGADLEVTVVEAMADAELAKKELTSDLYRFPALPPSLYSRVSYNPNAGSGGQLVLTGEKVTPLTGADYLLLNMLDPNDVAEVKRIVADLDSGDRGAWEAAVDRLPQRFTPIQPNEPYVHAALTATDKGVGYVTLAFNGSTNDQQVAPALPISLSVIKVVPKLFNGALEPIQPDNVLDEKFSMRYGADFAGEVENYDFQWRWAEPVGGLIPNTDFVSWDRYGDVDITNGLLTVDIEGSSPFAMADHYFAVRYRAADLGTPSGTNWSEWVYNFAPGWIDRVMDGITPYEQRLADMVENPADTTFSMISQAGAPYEGPIALNMDAINEYGLLQIYSTIWERAKALSLDAGINDPSLNQSLLKVISRINDLYMVLGNEAYADASDPTIAFGKDNEWLTFENYAAEASGLFSFMNQTASLLDEELVLLRGRNDTLEPSTQTSPFFNRMIWNYTKGIDGGEVAYALNYNIKGDPTNLTGTITAEDAERLYPQGHGDAWGYYLSALQRYYEILANPNFGWQTEPGAMLVGNAAVNVDYFDERKFAESAAAKARTGAEVMSRTYRKEFREIADGGWLDYRDSNTNRAWGVDGWASRVGQGAYFDWATGNSLLLHELTNMVQVGGTDIEPEGIQKIDRMAVPELQEICSSLKMIQMQMDNADSGFNPLGLARDVVPFDISPAAIDAGKTHFEQIYDRAKIALQNAETVFNHVKGTTQDMRAQADSVYSRQRMLAEQELDFHNRLIELYGYPYPEDIGPGKTYPEGYAGPDLINYQILDLEDLLGTEPDGTPLEVTILRYDFEAENDPGLKTDYTLTTNITGTTTIWIAENGLKVKDPAWTSRRPASGELQLALMDYVQQYYLLKAKAEYYEKLMEWIESHFSFLEDSTARTTNSWTAIDTNTGHEKTTADLIAGLKISKNLVELLAGAVAEEEMRAAGAIPETIEGVTGPFPVVQFKEDLSAGVKAIAAGSKWIEFGVANLTEDIALGREASQKKWNADLELLIAENEYKTSIQEHILEFEESMREQLIRESELYAQIEVLHQSYQRYLNLNAQGELLMAKRAQVRAQFSHRIQGDRYADMAFRIFRNEALQKYTATFDLAARYVYLAAKAYDYETALLDTETTTSPGSKFLSDIVRARSLGVLTHGEPQPYGGSGDPGLADIMARMKTDWDVVDSRFGFNNPDTETSRFSLRSERFRISPSLKSDGSWQNKLQSYVVDDLNEWDVFKRYCKPFTSSSEPQPAIVIPFDTTVMFSKNFFGRDLAGGDNAYDSSHQATKIRSVGIWFAGYNTTFNTNSTGGGLANEPRVYLIPVGEDVMRTPTGSHDELRHWKVQDQVMPLPYHIGGADLDDPDWIPVQDSLTENMGQIRRYTSLRAYHDRGQFVEAETHNNARLIGRSVWNTQWYLIIPGGTLLDDADEGIQRFIYGAEQTDGSRDGAGVTDVKLFFQTYSLWGN